MNWEFRDSELLAEENEQLAIVFVNALNASNRVPTVREK